MSPCPGSRHRTGRVPLVSTGTTSSPATSRPCAFRSRQGEISHAADRAGAPLVAIVGEGTARRFWPGQDPIGKQIVQQEFGARGPDPTAAKTLLIVGVARDVKASTLIDGLSSSLVYVPLQQQYLSSGHDPRAHDPGPADRRRAPHAGRVAEPQSADRDIADARGRHGDRSRAAADRGVRRRRPRPDRRRCSRRSASTVSTAYAVTRRTREIGIRMALGAQRADSSPWCCDQGVWLAIIGAAIGLLLAAGASRAARRLPLWRCAARSGDLRRRRRALCGRRPRGVLLARAASDADRSAGGASLRVAWKVRS